MFFFDSVLSNGKNIVIASDGAGNADTAILYYTGTAPNAPADDSAYITGLTSSNANDPAYFVNIPLHAQWPVYYQCDGNADNTFDSIPAVLTNARWIATKRQSDAASTTNLSFKISTALTAGADVFIMFTGQTTVPAWITSAGFANTNVTGRWRDNSLNLVGYQLFKKTYTPGSTVTLSSSAIDFVVLVRPTGATGIVPAAGQKNLRTALCAFKALGNNIIIPHDIPAAINSVAVYDLSGKLVRRIIGRENILALKKVSGFSNGVYIVRLETIPMQ